MDKEVSSVSELESLDEGDIVDDVKLFSKVLHELDLKMCLYLNYRESILCQKSRHKWIKEGDYNTNFFIKS